MILETIVNTWWGALITLLLYGGGAALVISKGYWFFPIYLIGMIAMGLGIAPNLHDGFATFFNIAWPIICLVCLWIAREKYKIEQKKPKKEEVK